MGVKGRFREQLQFTDLRARGRSGHLERRKSGKGRITLLPRRLHSKMLESCRVGFGSSHQSPGASRSSRKLSASQCWGSSEVALGQSDGCLLYKENGRDSEFSFKKRGLSTLEREHSERHNFTQPSLVGNIRQCVSRFSEQKRYGPMGVRVIKRSVRDDNGSLSIVSHIGCFCQQENKEVTEVHDMGIRSQGSGTQCIDSQVGPNNLPVSSSSTGDEIFAEDSGREVNSDPRGSQMANSSLVASDPGDDDRTIASASNMQVYTQNEEQVSRLTLPGPSGSSSSSISNVNTTLSSFLSNHLADGTKNGYKYAFSKFVSFCSMNNHCPKSCGPEVIAQYLKHLFDGGSSYSSVNLARSAISKYHDGYHGNTAGTHKLVTTAVKAVFRLRPPLPKYKNTYDITLVLDYLKSLPDNDQLTLKQLSMKTLFLLIMSSLSRVSSCARLGPDLLVYKVIKCLFYFHHYKFYIQDHVIVNLVSLEKQSRPGNIRGYLRIQNFIEDLHLCPMAALVEYNNRVSF